MKILIATDGSEYSRKAVEKCCQIISAEGHTDIKIISTVDRITPIAAEPFGVSNQFYAEIETDLLNQAQNAVDAAKEIFRAKCAAKNISIETEVFKGSVKETIVDEAKDFKADIIAVGSHGYGFLNRMLLGSVSDFVIHHAPCSVLVVRG
jgi:nucleotide-binding universal stress UspA family protein